MSNTFRKGDIIRAIVKGVVYAGAFTIAASSPRFVSKVMPMFLRHASYELRRHKDRQRKFTNAFYYLKKKGLLNLEYYGRQLYISLTEEGQKLFKRYRIDDMQIKKPKRWDKKWRVLIFDVPDEHRIKREALRGKLKELGLYQLQKSVWVCPYEFEEEVCLLRDFFNFEENEMKIIEASKIENDGAVRGFFKI